MYIQTFTSPELAVSVMNYYEGSCWPVPVSITIRESGETIVIYRGGGQIPNNLPE